MSEHKTHAEIVAEIRFHGQQNIDAEKDKPEFGILTMEGRIAVNYADELEAAHKRELDELRKQVGNAAKMREALRAIKDINDGRPHGAHGYEINDIIEEALAELPRNCDRFKTKEEAAIEFANEKKQWIPQQFLWELAPWLDWLFATETKERTYYYDKPRRRFADSHNNNKNMENKNRTIQYVKVLHGPDGCYVSQSSRQEPMSRDELVEVVRRWYDNYCSSATHIDNFDEIDIRIIGSELKKEIKDGGK